MLITELLDHYKKFAEAALAFAGTRLNKSFHKTIIEILILYMVIPRKINFLQMERYGDRYEQCYRQTFGKYVVENPRQLMLTFFMGFEITPPLHARTRESKTTKRFHCRHTTGVILILLSRVNLILSRWVSLACPTGSNGRGFSMGIRRPLL